MIYFTLTFLISVMASIIAYYICKWLDREESNGNQPEE